MIVNDPLAMGLSSLSGRWKCQSECSRVVKNKRVDKKHRLVTGYARKVGHLKVQSGHQNRVSEIFQI